MPAGVDGTPPTTSTARCRATRAPSCCPASCSPSTLGRDGRPDPARAHRRGRSPCATSCPTPTCTRSTCCGRSTRSSSSSARYPASCARCSTCWARRTVVAGADDDRSRSGAVRRRRRRARCSTGRARRARDRAYGPVRRARRAAGRRSARPRALPEVRRYDLPPTRRHRARRAARPRDGRRRLRRGARRAGRVRRAARATGRCSTPATSTPAQLRAAAADGAEVVVTDSNRRRVFVASRLAQNTGADAGRRRPAVRRTPRVLDPFAGPRRRRPDRRRLRRACATCARPFSPGFSQFPEHRPFAGARRRPGDGVAGRPRARRRRAAALDDRLHRAARRRPRRPAALRRRARAASTAVEIAGRTLPPCTPGWNRLALRPARRALAERADRRRRASRATRGRRRGRHPRAAIPGVRCTEALRPPLLAERALRGARPARAPALTYLLRAHDRRRPVPPRPVGAGPRRRGLVRDRGDGERGARRA